MIGNFQRPNITVFINHSTELFRNLKKDMCRNINQIHIHVNKTFNMNKSTYEVLHHICTFHSIILNKLLKVSLFLHPQISIQISDLRSVVCKEACRTVALLAHRLGAIFAPLAEFWLPTLFKLLGDSSIGIIAFQAIFISICQFE